MKKIALLFFTLVILSCSKENNDNSLTTDPIIGIWVDPTGENSRGTIVIESNGIALSAIEGDAMDNILAVKCQKSLHSSKRARL